MPLKIIDRDGVWHLTGTVSGRRLRQSTGTRDRALAEDIRIATEARLARERHYGPAHETTWAEACVLYVDAGKSRKYLSRILPEIGRRSIASLKPGDIRAMAQRLYPTQAPGTRNRCAIVPAVAVINHAADCGLCPPIKVRRFAEPRVLRAASDRAWIDAFRAEAAPHLGTMALFSFVTGARAGDCIGLRPRDLDLDAKRATAPRTKNGDPRVFYLTDELVRALRLLPARRIQHGRGDERVFGFASHRSFYAAWDAAIARAGIARLTFHEAGRHGFGTEMVVRQRQDVVTTARLGHWKDPRVLLERYAHAADLGAVAERIFGTKLTQSGKVKRVK
jgi:integrase